MVQIHEYMLSKASPTSQPDPAQGSGEQPVERESEAPASLPDAGAQPPSDEIAAADERIIEGVLEAPANVNMPPPEIREPREVPARVSNDQLLQRPVTRIQKPADDRLFTWAAVGLTVAIVVLLLKKFLKSGGHGAVFMDGS